MCEEYFQAKDLKIYKIQIDDDGTEISVFYENEKMGSISLRVIEDDFVENTYYHITNLSLQECRRRGLGRECLVFHKSTFGYPLTASGQSTSEKYDDGSHLTGDGVGFINKMRIERIVELDPDFKEGHEEYDFQSKDETGFL